jgi:hypothetical protein
VINFNDSLSYFHVTMFNVHTVHDNVVVEKVLGLQLWGYYVLIFTLLNDFHHIGYYYATVDIVTAA